MTTTRQIHIKKVLWWLRIMSFVFLAGFSFSLSVSVAQAATAAKKGVKVSIVNFQFTPAETTIAPWESVTWTNNDAHRMGWSTVTAHGVRTSCCPGQALAADSINRALTITTVRSIRI